MCPCSVPLVTLLLTEMVTKGPAFILPSGVILAQFCRMSLQITPSPLLKNSALEGPHQTANAFLPYDPVQTYLAICKGRAIFHFFKALNAEWWVDVHEGLMGRPWGMRSWRRCDEWCGHWTRPSRPIVGQLGRGVGPTLLQPWVYPCLSAPLNTAPVLVPKNWQTKMHQNSAK